MRDWAQRQAHYPGTISKARCSISIRHMKKQFIALLATTLTFAALAADKPLSFETTFTPDKVKGMYRVEARISTLESHDGKVKEVLICAPTLESQLGKDACFFSGETLAGNVVLDGVEVKVFFPKEGARDFAWCTITVTQAKQVISQATVRLKLAE